MSAFSETHWRSLRYLNLYRVVVAGLLCLASKGISNDHAIYLGQHFLSPLDISGFYFVMTMIAVMSSRYWHAHFNLQLTLLVVVDVLVLTSLMYTAEGARSGFGILLLVSLAGAGLVGHGRLVVSYAALATLAVLGAEVYQAMGSEFDPHVFMQAGVLSVGFFAMAISARMAAQRLLANEELAHQRGVALHNQMLISQRAIEEMQDGVLVVSQDGVVRQHNPRAEVMLGVSQGAVGALFDFYPALATGFCAWKRGGIADPEQFWVASTGLTLRMRFVPTESSERDVLVFLEDMGRVHDHARQIKLAALGRLTANIAHEIRNPLSAISHAGELLLEERRGEAYERLLCIVCDNAKRLERIVNDVLELGRRDRVHSEPIDANDFLASFLEEFCNAERIARKLVRVEGELLNPISFDRSHLHQILWNIIGNALRYCSKQPASIIVTLSLGEMGEQKLFELIIRDDGGGVPADVREHLFEPFFTTHSRGTGLGLYIARELCEANGARLELLADAPGAHFRIWGELYSDQ